MWPRAFPWLEWEVALLAPKVCTHHRALKFGHKIVVLNFWQESFGPKMLIPKFWPPSPKILWLDFGQNSGLEEVNCAVAKKS